MTGFNEALMHTMFNAYESAVIPNALFFYNYNTIDVFTFEGVLH